MGFFDFFKKKKADSYLDNMPPAMRQAFAVLFPNGNADHDRQLDELCKHFGNKYKREDIDSNLIFILTGYLITGDAKTKDNSINKVLSRPNNTMSKADVEYLYNFALRNHPKLAPLLVAQKAVNRLSSDGCTTDTIPGGYGPFGLTPDNPIPTKGVEESYYYLDHLRDANGNKISYTRIGSTMSSISQNPIDVYKLSAKSTFGSDQIFISAYHRRTSQLSPSGYVLVDNNNIVISNGGTRFITGHKCEANSAPSFKLVALNYFGVISSSELKTMPSDVAEAEELNRRGFIASNNGKPEEAIKLLKEAIDKGSKNAVNSLFAVYHCTDRYKEGYQLLLDCYNNNRATAASLYNLAVISCGFAKEEFSFAERNFFTASQALYKAIELPDDGLEEYRPRLQKQAKTFLDYVLDSIEDLP